MVAFDQDLLTAKRKYLFSVDEKKIKKAVYLILEELGQTTTRTTEFDLTNLNSISVHVITTKGKIEAQNTKINKLERFIEKQKTKRKIIVVANTYKELPIKNRANKEHLDHAMKLFFETNNTLFLTTLSLYKLHKKVITDQISVQEASSLIQNQSGEIQI